MERSVAKILVFLSVITVIGLVTLYSASYIATYKYPFPPPNYYFDRQISAIVVGAVLMLFTSFFDYKKHESYTGIYYVITIVALLSVFFSKGVYGSHRWISFGPLSFQSSSLAKLFLLVYLAAYVYREKERMSTFKKGVLEPLLKLSPIYLLVFVEPDLGTTAFLVTLTLAILYVSGARLYHILSILGIGALVIFGAYKLHAFHTYQIDRLSSFFSFLTTGHTNYQASMALSAINHGGFWGVGPGAGIYKFYLPVQFSDFIFAVFGEEFGILGMTILIFLYYMLVREIVHVGLKIDDIYARVYVVGYAFMIAFQVLLNAGVSLGIVPVTGVTLPFVSYGGSSIVTLMAGLGVVINIAYSSKG